MKRPPSSVSGFTITELLVVVAIAGILAAIAIPSFKSMSQSQQVRSASIDLYSNLVLARSEAIKRNSDVTITPVDPAHNEMGWVVAAGSVKIRDQSQLKGIALTVTPNNSPWVTYRGSGRTTATTAPVFKIDAFGETTPYLSCIKIELSGMPRIYKPVSGAC